MKKIYSIYQIALRSFTASGTLASARELLPYLSENGFDIVYLCPVFDADPDTDESTWSQRQKASGTYNPKNPYKMRDYFNVDIEYGTNEDLKSFVDTAHSLGLRVMLDLVYLHCGKNAVFAKDHPEYLICDENNKPIVGENWPFARINYECRELREYLWSNMEYYVRDYGVDGYRCDVGDNVPLDFWREGIRRIKAIKPDIVMLNEGSRIDYNEVFDLCYLGYDLTKIITADDPVSQLVSQQKERYAKGYTGHMINSIENHDSASDNRLDRFECTMGHELTDLVFLLIYTLDVTPFIFNGNEIADSSEQCMFSNRFHGKRAGIDWSNLLREHGKRRLELIRALNALRRSNDALLFGDVTVCEEAQSNLLLFKRTYENKCVTVAINTGSSQISVNFDTVGKTVLLKNNVDITSNIVTLGRYGYILFASQN